ncbi:MAG: DUF3179 domain-containing protein [Gemmatimonadales bacterium]
MPRARQVGRRLVVAAALAVSAALPAGAQETWRTDFTRSTVDPSEIVSGGPPKDGIPAIDAPRFESARDANRRIDPDEPVAVLRRNGEAKAYPLQILIWHEIVNDVVGGEPISVTYCPLCNTTLAFDRRFEGVVLDFGTTGRLRFSDLIMYDRQTETWWQQATGEGIVGEHAGRVLRQVPAPVMRWRDVREQIPDVRVLSRDTGFPGYRERYGMNPYRGYDTQRGPMAWTFGRDVPAGLPAMERVVAIELGGESWAVPFGTLRERRIAELTVGGTALVVFYTPETVSAVDAARIQESRAVGSSAVYLALVSGRRLRFEPGPDRGSYRDRETGSTWEFSGRAISGPLQGTQLEEVAHGNHFWFAWGVFRPETRIFDGTP